MGFLRDGRRNKRKFSIAYGVVVGVAISECTDAGAIGGRGGMRTIGGAGRR